MGNKKENFEETEINDIKMQRLHDFRYDKHQEFELLLFTANLDQVPDTLVSLEKSMLQTEK